MTQQTAATISDKIFDVLALLAEGQHREATLRLDELHEEVGRVRYGKATLVLLE